MRVSQATHFEKVRPKQRLIFHSTPSARVAEQDASWIRLCFSAASCREGTWLHFQSVGNVFFKRQTRTTPFLASHLQLHCFHPSWRNEGKSDGVLGLQEPQIESSTEKPCHIAIEQPPTYHENYKDSTHPTLKCKSNTNSKRTSCSFACFIPLQRIGPEDHLLQARGRLGRRKARAFGWVRA